MFFSCSHTFFFWYSAACMRLLFYLPSGRGRTILHLRWIEAGLHTTYVNTHLHPSNWLISSQIPRTIPCYHLKMLANTLYKEYSWSEIKKQLVFKQFSTSYSTYVYSPPCRLKWQQWKVLETTSAPFDAVKQPNVTLSCLNLHETNFSRVTKLLTKWSKYITDLKIIHQ